MKKSKVLFVCIHNSARSQMAEAFLNQIAGDRFEARSAGLEPGVLNPLAVEVMQELGIDISNNQTKDVFEMFKRGEMYSYESPSATVLTPNAARSSPVLSADCTGVSTTRQP